MTGPVRAVPARVGFVVALALSTLIASCYFAVKLMFVYPPPWPDETLFADVADHFVRTGMLGTDLYREALPSLATHFFMTPPLYLLLIAAVFRVTGPGLLTLRLVSVAISLVVLALTYGVARRVGFGRVAALGATALLPGSILFFRCALTGRMDGMSLALVLLALWQALGEAGRQGAPRPGPTRAKRFGMGCIAGLAFLTHPLGAMALPAAIAILAAAPHRSGPPAADSSLSRSPGRLDWALQA